MLIRYFNSQEDVRVGDHVSIGIFFRKRFGRVVYVPGISALNPEFEYNGMTWVGLRLKNGTLVATPVSSKTRELKSKVHLVSRDTSPIESIEARSGEFEKSGEGPAF